MGVEIVFYRDGVRVGSAHFSAFTLRRQGRQFGLDFADCLTYGEDGESEMVGSPDVSPDDDKDLVEPWQPNWERGLERVRRLFKMARDAGSDYDIARIPPFAELVEQAAREPRRWTVTWHD